MSSQPAAAAAAATAAVDVKKKSNKRPAAAAAAAAAAVTVEAEAEGGDGQDQVVRRGSKRKSTESTASRKHGRGAKRTVAAVPETVYIALLVDLADKQVRCTLPLKTHGTKCGALIRAISESAGHYSDMDAFIDMFLPTNKDQKEVSDLEKTSVWAKLVEFAKGDIEDKDDLEAELQSLADADENTLEDVLSALNELGGNDYFYRIEDSKYSPF